jgi:hypothetical protein
LLPCEPVGGFAARAFLRALLFRNALIQQLRKARTMRPPTTLATGMTMFLLSLIQLEISFATDAPLHWPLEHFPPPWQEVPSRKFWFIVTHMFGPNCGDAQDRRHPCDEHAYVSLLLVRAPIMVLHCRSRDVH